MKTHFNLFVLLTLTTHIYPMQHFGLFLQWTAQKLGFSKPINQQPAAQIDSLTKDQNAGAAQPSYTTVHAAANFTFVKGFVAHKEDQELALPQACGSQPSAAVHADFSDLLALATHAAAQSDLDWKPQAGEQWQYDPEADREARIILAISQHEDRNPWPTPSAPQSNILPKLSTKKRIKQVTAAQAQQDLRAIMPVDEDLNE